MRAIDADALFEAMIKTIAAMMKTRRWMRQDKDNEDEILSVIQNAPTLGLAPVVHGEWIEHKRAEESENFLISNYECTVCRNWERKKTDYCPNCGAKMDGGKIE